jgi:hypothetical protein
MVKDRPNLKCTLLLAECPLDTPETLVSPGYLLGRQLGVCPEHKLSVKPSIGFYTPL